MTGSQGQDTSEALAELAGHILHGLTNDWELVAFIREESAQPWRDALCQAAAVLAAGWVSPADHQRALAAERERAWDEGFGAGKDAAYTFTSNPYRAAIARGNPHTKESP